MVEEKPDGALVTTRETKGLDLVRRDWCTLSRQAGSAVLDFILSGKARDEVVSDVCSFLSDIKEKIGNPNPELRTPNPNPEPRTPNPEPRTRTPTLSLTPRPSPLTPDPNPRPERARDRAVHHHQAAH